MSTRAASRTAGGHGQRMAALGVLVALVLAAVMATEPATADSSQSAVSGGPLTGTFMVGDSTTWHVTPELRTLEPDWYLDQHPGRPVRALPAHIEHYLRFNPRPANFVMALGTNRSHRPEWSEKRLRDAIALLPRQTNVFLMLVVRAGSYQHDKDVTLRLYNSYSRDLARTRPHTYLIDWRHAVLDDPTLNPVTGRSSLLSDGTHESGGERGDRPGPGVSTYLRLVIDEWSKVNHVAPIHVPRRL